MPILRASENTGDNIESFEALFALLSEFPGIYRSKSSFRPGFAHV